MQHFTRTVVAGNDLSAPGDLYKAITLSGDFAQNGRNAMGILLEGASSGRNVTVGVMGVMPFASEDISSAGGALTCQGSGWFSNLKSGDYEVGFAYGHKGTDQVQVNSGAIGEGLFNFAVTPYLTSSMGVQI